MDSINKITEFEKRTFYGFCPEFNIVVDIFLLFIQVPNANYRNAKGALC